MCDKSHRLRLRNRKEECRLVFRVSGVLRLCCFAFMSGKFPQSTFFVFLSLQEYRFPEIYRDRPTMDNEYVILVTIAE